MKYSQTKRDLLGEQAILLELFKEAIKVDDNYDEIGRISKLLNETEKKLYLLMQEEYKPPKTSVLGWIKKLFKKAGKDIDDLVAGIITTKKDKFDDVEDDEL